MKISFIVELYEDLQHKMKPSNSSDKNWILYRLDDNGNEVEMFRFRDKTVAEQEMLKYEARGHKQTYFIKKATP